MNANHRNFEVELAAAEKRREERVQLSSEASVKLTSAMTAKEARST